MGGGGRVIVLPTPDKWGRIDPGQKGMAKLAAPAGFISQMGFQKQRDEKNGW
jgi:hypothetical protein